MILAQEQAGVAPHASVGDADLEGGLAVVRAAAAGRPGGVFGPGCWSGASTAKPRCSSPPAAPCCCSWRTPGWPRQSPSIRAASPTRWDGFTARSPSSLQWCSARPTVATARRFYDRHMAVGGVLEEGAGAFAAGSRYQANDVAALCWVVATLADSALVAFELALPPLSTEERERYYAE
ncbi:MAG TPA: oxygenase MpaB family protein [Stellaceae bacterium]|nr:oxygenase MpaB family protein [Stellaceae bacterium]